MPDRKAPLSKSTLLFGQPEPPHFANWAHDDAWLKAVEGRDFFRNAGEARFSQEFLSDADLRKTAFFNDWGRIYGAERSLALKITDSRDQDAPVMHLTLFRKLTDKPFTKGDQTRLRMLWPTLQSAVRARWALRSPDYDAQVIDRTLNAIPTPTWIVRDNAHIDFSNVAAHELVRSCQWVREQAGGLHSIAQVGNATLRNYIRHATKIGACVWVVCADVKGRLLRGQLSVIPIAQTALYASKWPRASALLMLQAPPSPDQDGQWLAHLAVRFHLTRMQSLVLEDLGRGLSVEGIAAARGIKEGTVRTHLHDLLAKTGRVKQGDLVRLALGV